VAPLLKRVLTTITHLRAQGATNAQIGEFVREIVNSPILELAVAATPTPLDDLVLAGLKVLFPPAG
jgi:hypothetical protein